MDNFFMWIISGLIYLIQLILSAMLPAADTSHAMFFAGVLSSGASIVFELVFAFFSVFNLTIPAVCLGVILVCWLLQNGISIYLFITILIKRIPFL